MNKTISIILLSILSFSSFAKDLGIQGKTWEINDIDLRLIIMKQLSEINWDKQGEKWKKSVKDQLNHMKYTVSSPPVEEINIRPIDMSTVITKDLTAKVRNADGSISTVVLARKGEKINPFDYIAPFTTYLFFDPEDLVQYKFAIDLKSSYLTDKYHIDFAITGGDLLSTADKLEGVYYAYPFIVNRFKINRSFSFVLYSKKLKKAVVVELPKDITLEELNETIKKLYD